MLTSRRRSARSPGSFPASIAGAFADGLHGWRREIQVAGARHLAFHDTVLLAPALPRITGATPALAAEAYGVIDARRVVEVTRAYVRPSSISSCVVGAVPYLTAPRGASPT